MLKTHRHQSIGRPVPVRVPNPLSFQAVYCYWSYLVTIMVHPLHSNKCVRDRVARRSRYCCTFWDPHPESVCNVALDDTSRHNHFSHERHFSLPVCTHVTPQSLTVYIYIYGIGKVAHPVLLPPYATSYLVSPFFPLSL